MVAAFFVAYFTKDELLGVHTWAGYAVAAYVIVRVIWGFVGPQHARFRDFAYGPVKAFRYLIDTVRAKAPRYIGHSPAGAMMVFALLFMLTGTVITGMAELALSRGEGPLAVIVDQRSKAAGGQPTDVSQDDDIRDERRAGGDEESAMLELHELFANLTLVLAVLHVAGVVIASWAHKENLVGAMITGRKRVEEPPG